MSCQAIQKGLCVAPCAPKSGLVGSTRLLNTQEFATVNLCENCSMQSGKASDEVCSGAMTDYRDIGKHCFHTDVWIKVQRILTGVAIDNYHVAIMGFNVLKLHFGYLRG